MPTCKITSLAANLLRTESQIIDYKYYAQPQVPYQSEGEHYHAYRNSTPLLTSTPKATVKVKKRWADTLPLLVQRNSPATTQQSSDK
jgi:hypothetical protein